MGTCIGNLTCPFMTVSGPALCLKRVLGVDGWDLSLTMFMLCWGLCLFSVPSSGTIYKRGLSPSNFWSLERLYVYRLVSALWAIISVKQQAILVTS